MARINRRSFLASGWLLAAGGALGLFLTTPALAGHRDGDRYERHSDRHDRYERRHGRHDRHERHRYRRSSYRRGYESHRRGPRVHVHGDSCGYRSSHRSESYYCEPCGHRFHSRHRFHRHLTGHHHIPLWKLPFVIVHSALGWIFHG